MRNSFKSLRKFLNIRSKTRERANSFKKCHNMKNLWWKFSFINYAHFYDWEFSFRTNEMPRHEKVRWEKILRKFLRRFLFFGVFTKGFDEKFLVFMHESSKLSLKSCFVTKIKFSGTFSETFTRKKILFHSYIIFVSHFYSNFTFSRAFTLPLSSIHTSSRDHASSTHHFVNDLLEKHAETLLVVWWHLNFHSCHSRNWVAFNGNEGNL